MAKKKSAAKLAGLTEHRKKFVNLLNKFTAYGYSRFSVFTDFLTLTAISLANGSDPHGYFNDKAVIDERETEYKRIFGKYKPEVQSVFDAMFKELLLEMETYQPPHYTDVLGELFHELNFNDEWKGQFFTPQNVCDMMSMMTFDSNAVKAAIDGKGYVAINEPCCGGGAIILGAANAMNKLGFNPQRHMLTIATDLDERCVHMCYIQCSLYGLPVAVQQMDSLRQIPYGAPWLTPIFVLGGWSFKARKFFETDDTPQPAPEPKTLSTPTEAVKPTKPVQLTLF